ncbi:MAG: prepilin peptidase [Candidatus Gastranaerophilales bacterium]|nr:prepilin peptidase [Candidatus Gastranaerophilales bacterium]
MFWAIYLTVFVLAIGLCIGSFLNVVVLRAFSGESIVLPPSKCPQCHNKLKWYDNIPVLSYLILGGKCRFCHKHISKQYPIVELTTAIIFWIIFYRFGLTLLTPFVWIIASLGIVIAVSDIKERVVFDVHTISFIVISLLFSLYTHNIIQGLCGMALGAFVMELLARIGLLLVKKRAFGEGDTFIAAGLGALFGAKGIILVLAMSLVLQALTILPSFIKRMWNNDEKPVALGLVAFFVAVIAYKYIEYNTLLPILVQSALLLIVLVLGVYLCFATVKITKTSQNLTYLPFGPALLISGFLFLIWQNQIMHWVSAIL